MGMHYHWRFKGEKLWRYGWPTEAGGGLVRMGNYNGDTIYGPVVDPNDIEIRPYRS